MPPGRLPGQGFGCKDPALLAAWGKVGGEIGGKVTKRRYSRATRAAWSSRGGQTTAARHAGKLSEWGRKGALTRKEAGAQGLLSL